MRSTTEVCCQLCSNTIKTLTLEEIFSREEIVCNRHGRTITFPQMLLVDYFENIGFKCEIEYKINKQVYDIYVSNLNLLIEYDGGRWHKDLNNDISKVEKTIKNDELVKILRIRDHKCPNFSKKINNVSIINFGYKMEEMLEKIQEFLLSEYGISRNNNYKIEQRKKEIYLSMKRFFDRNSIYKKYPKLVDLYAEDDKDILKYITINTKIKLNWKCNKCNESYAAKPITILNKLKKDKKIECFKCEMKGENLMLWFQKQDKFQFLNSAKNLDSREIKVHSGINITAKCKKCGYIISDKPVYKITQLKDCPKCGNGKKTLEEILVKRPDIIFSDKNEKTPYEIPQNSKEKVIFICNNKGCKKEVIHQARWLKRGGKCSCKKKSKPRIAKKGNSIADWCPQIIKIFDFDRNTRSPYDLTKSSAVKIYLTNKINPIYVYDYYKQQKKLGLVK